MSTVQNADADRYTAEMAVSGGVTLVTMHGTLSEVFDARKLAGSIRTKTLIIHMSEVRRFASWGMSEWMDFLRATADCDVYLVECSTYAVSQLNLITGLLGHAKLVSFYASYRCGSCSEELQTLFLIPRDREAIRDIPGSHRECPTCGGRARLEEYPAAFFDTIATRASFDIDDEALGFMRSRLHYELSPDLTRFRAYRRVHKEHTYLRLTGNIATLPPEVLARASTGTTVVDLENVVFEAPNLTAWRAYLQAASARASSLQLLHCPPEFLETALQPYDLNDKLKVRSFAMNYECGTCGTTTTHVIDVAENLEELVTGIVPSVRCRSCRLALVATLRDDQVALLRALPARTRDAALDSFLTKARAEPAEKLENCLTLAATLPPAPKSGRRFLYGAGALGVLLVAALGAVAAKLWTQPTAAPVTALPAVAAQPPPDRPTFTRPDWIIADVPGTAYCHDMINRLMCVGISAYRANRDDGVTEASDAALEELVSAVGLKISEPFFRDTVIPMYSDVRAHALATLQTASLDRGGDPHAAATVAYTAADTLVRTARKRVVDALRASGGAAVPVQRSDWYWEEYAATSGAGTEFLVFVRFDVSLDAIRALVDKYSALTTVGGTSATTAFPALAWLRPSFAGGAFLTKVGPPLAAAGIAPQSIVVAVGDQHVADASTFAHHLDDALHATGKLELTVAAGTAPDAVVRVR